MPSAQDRRRDPLCTCSVCHGHRILRDVVGVSVCGWCDGSGYELDEKEHRAFVAGLARAVELARAAADESGRPNS